MSPTRRTFLKLAGAAAAAMAIPLPVWLKPERVAVASGMTRVSFHALPPRFWRARWNSDMGGYIEGAPEIEGPWARLPDPPYTLIVYGDEKNAAFTAEIESA